ncbi:uncharacterized protein LOC101859287 [Aplysia californica]|uniref:Uncharacterized protein LOC101859287 n=1 Tax=Aplysia californica TaxID=6500 RepID=A0ABM0ZVW6_APLCA|nr:uncharacterized protein LOC101859287 [Aplysia californica]
MSVSVVMADEAELLTNQMKRRQAENISGSIGRVETTEEQRSRREIQKRYIDVDILSVDKSEELGRSTEVANASGVHNSPQSDEQHSAVQGAECRSPEATETKEPRSEICSTNSTCFTKDYTEDTGKSGINHGRETTAAADTEQAVRAVSRSEDWSPEGESVSSTQAPLTVSPSNNYVQWSGHSGRDFLTDVITGYKTKRRVGRSRFGLVTTTAERIRRAGGRLERGGRDTRVVRVADHGVTSGQAAAASLYTSYCQFVAETEQLEQRGHGKAESSETGGDNPDTGETGGQHRVGAESNSENQSSENSETGGSDKQQNTEASNTNPDDLTPDNTEVFDSQRQESAANNSNPEHQNLEPIVSSTTPVSDARSQDVSPLEETRPESEVNTLNRNDSEEENTSSRPTTENQKDGPTQPHSLEIIKEETEDDAPTEDVNSSVDSGERKAEEQLIRSARASVLSEISEYILSVTDNALGQYREQVTETEKEEDPEELKTETQEENICSSEKEKFTDVVDGSFDDSENKESVVIPDDIQCGKGDDSVPEGKLGETSSLASTASSSKSEKVPVPTTCEDLDTPRDLVGPTVGTGDSVSETGSFDFVDGECGLSEKRNVDTSEDIRDRNNTLDEADEETLNVDDQSCEEPGAQSSDQRSVLCEEDHRCAEQNSELERENLEQRADEVQSLVEPDLEAESKSNEINQEHFGSADVSHNPPIANGTTSDCQENQDFVEQVQVRASLSNIDNRDNVQEPTLPEGNSSVDAQNNFSEQGLENSTEECASDRGSIKSGSTSSLDSNKSVRSQATSVHKGNEDSVAKLSSKRKSKIREKINHKSLPQDGLRQKESSQEHTLRDKTSISSPTKSVGSGQYSDDFDGDEQHSRGSASPTSQVSKQLDDVNSEAGYYDVSSEQSLEDIRAHDTEFSAEGGNLTPRQRSFRPRTEHTDLGDSDEECENSSNHRAVAPDLTLLQENSTEERAVVGHSTPNMQQSDPSCQTRTVRPKSSHPRRRGQNDTDTMSTTSSKRGRLSSGASASSRNSATGSIRNNKENHKPPPRRRQATPDGGSPMNDDNSSVCTEEGSATQGRATKGAETWSLNSDDSRDIHKTDDVIGMVSHANSGGHVTSPSPSDKQNLHRPESTNGDGGGGVGRTFLTEDSESPRPDASQAPGDDGSREDSLSLQFRNGGVHKPGTCAEDAGISGIPINSSALAGSNSPDSNRDRLSRIQEAVDRMSYMQGSLQELFGEAKSILTDYQSQLMTRPIVEFADEVPEFTRAFTSLSGAYRACEDVTGGINRQLGDIRSLTDDICGLISHNYQSAGLEAWSDGSENSWQAVQTLKEERVAQKKIQEARVKEVKAISARAVAEAQTAQELVAKAEGEAAEAEIAAQNARQEAELAVRRADEAREAAESKRQAEEESRRKAEERARQKAEEERRRKEEEERRIREEALKRGTSVDDERHRAMEEKRKAEEERKNPNNWPRFIYSVDPSDFDPGVGAIVRSLDGLDRDDLHVSLVDQLTGGLPLEQSEELVSNILHLRQTDPDKPLKLTEPLAVAIPHCSPRLHPGREPVVKMRRDDGGLVTLPTEEVCFEDIKELRFVQVRLRKLGTLAVFLRLKKETLTFYKKGGKVASSTDPRITLTSQPGAFANNINFKLEIQPVDHTLIQEIKAKKPVECGKLLSCSPIVSIYLQTKFSKPLTITLPCPSNPALRPRRPQTAANRLGGDRAEPKDTRPLSARPLFGGGEAVADSETSEEVHLLIKEPGSSWTRSDDVTLLQSKKRDIVSFEIARRFERIAVIRTKPDVTAAQSEKMIGHVIMSLTYKPVSVVMRQKSAEPSSVVLTCTPPSNVDRVIKTLADEGYDHGPRPGRELQMSEGQRLELRFRGNLGLTMEDVKQQVAYNTHIPFKLNFEVTEKDKFAQKGFDSYRGFCQLFTTGRVKRPLEPGEERDRVTGQRVKDEWVDGDLLLCEQLVILPKPDPETPRPLTVAPVNFVSEGLVNDELLRFLSTHLQYSDWRKLAQLLTVKRSRLQAILRQNVNHDVTQTIYDVLVTWSKRLPRALDRTEILCQAITSIGRPDLAEELRVRDEEHKQARAANLRDSHLRKAFITVAKNPMASSQWRQLCRYLGVEEGELNHIEGRTESTHERCLAGLDVWRETVGERASVSTLAEKLRGCRYRRLAREIETSS